VPNLAAARASGARRARVAVPSRYYRAVLLTLPIRDVRPATPRARIVRLDLDGQPFAYDAGQAVFVGTHGGSKRKPYSIAAAPEDARRDRCLELLVGVEADGTPGEHLALDEGVAVDVEGPVGSFTFPAAPEERRFVVCKRITRVYTKAYPHNDKAEGGQCHIPCCGFFNPSAR